MKLEELYLKRQSCRKFKQQAVEREKLEQLIESARLAPSACNSQPWLFYVVHTPEAVAKVIPATQEMGANRFTTNAAAFIIVVEDKAKLSERVGMRFKDQDFASIDLGLAVSQLVLRATQEGLSTCILGWFNEKALKEAFGIERRIRMVIAVGYAADDDPIREKKRKDISDIARYV